MSANAYVPPVLGHRGVLEIIKRVISSIAVFMVTLFLRETHKCFKHKAVNFGSNLSRPGAKGYKHVPVFVWSRL